MNIMETKEFEEEDYPCCPHCDFDDYFNRVNIRNNRLKRLIELNAFDEIIDNEKLMLREAVDKLLAYLEKNKGNYWTECAARQ